MKFENYLNGVRIFYSLSVPIIKTIFWTKLLPDELYQKRSGAMVTESLIHDIFYEMMIFDESLL